MGTKIIDEVAEFLARVPAFRLLGRGRPARARRAASRSTSSPPAPPCSPRGGPRASFSRSWSPAASRSSLPAGDGGEVEVDYRSEGAAIGYLSLLSGERSRMNVTAVEDTVCYLIPREPFLALLERRPDDPRVLHAGLHRHLPGQGLQRPARDQPRPRRRASSCCSRPRSASSRRASRSPPRPGSRSGTPPGSCRATGSARWCSPTPTGAPVGIVTDRDLRDKVAAVGPGRRRAGREHHEPDRSSRSTPAELCFDALLAMIRNNVHHLPVLEQGRLRGVITNHDLMLLPGHLAALGRPRDRGPAGPRGARPRRPQGRRPDRPAARGGRPRRQHHPRHHRDQRPARAQGPRAGRRASSGPAPVAWCWIVFGSEGRREQTFKTDQDNAIVYADPRDAEAGAAGAGLVRRVHAPGPRRARALRLPALPGRLHGGEPRLVPAAARAGSTPSRLDRRTRTPRRCCTR